LEIFRLLQLKDAKAFDRDSICWSRRLACLNVDPQEGKLFSRNFPEQTINMGLYIIELAIELKRRRLQLSTGSTKASDRVDCDAEPMVT